MNWGMWNMNGAGMGGMASPMGQGAPMMGGMMGQGMGQMTPDGFLVGAQNCVKLITFNSLLKF